jgi:murein DD-endopeptidase MepM/ murein hydrolase activator NlpD
MLSRVDHGRKAALIVLLTVATIFAGSGAACDYLQPDKTPPVIQSCQIPQWAVDYENVDFKVDASDDRGVKEVYVQFTDGSKIPLSKTSDKRTDAGDESEWDASQKLPVGVYKYHIVAKDERNETDSNLLELTVGLYTVKGVVYADYNGDGINEDNEPVIPGVEMRADLNDANLFLLLSKMGYKCETLLAGQYTVSVMTDKDGAYSVPLTAGEYKLHVDADNIRGYNSQPYRYISLSRAEFRDIGNPLEIKVGAGTGGEGSKDNGNATECDVGLMQGFLTLPFGSDTKLLVNEKKPHGPLGVAFYVDMDDRKDHIATWDGSGRTYDNHQGTDFCIEENTPVLAAAPGVVVPYDLSCEPVEGCFVLIQHESPYKCYTSPNTYYSVDTVYGHLNKVNVKVGDKVKRGDVIGLSGGVDPLAADLLPYIPDGKHLHFEVDLLTKPTFSTKTAYWSDPYRNIVPYSFSLAYGLHSTIGIWTKDDDPQFP